MRGVPSLISDIRKKVFTEVARMAYNGDDYTKAEDLPSSWSEPLPVSGCGLPWVFPCAASRPAAS